MNTQTPSTLWFSENQQNFYLLPKNLVVFPGTDVLVNLDDEKMFIQLEQMAEFKCSPERAKAHLDQSWQSALDAAKKAIGHVQAFAQMQGKSVDTDSMEQSLNAVLGGETDVSQAFKAGKEAVESIMQGVKAEKAGEGNPAESFDKLLGHMQELLSLFDENNREAAKKNPEEWTRELYQKFFGEEEAAKKKANKERLNQEVQESINRGLRKAGLTPADEMEDEEHNS